MLNDNSPYITVRNAGTELNPDSGQPLFKSVSHKRRSTYPLNAKVWRLLARAICPQSNRSIAIQEAANKSGGVANGNTWPGGGEALGWRQSNAAQELRHARIGEYNPPRPAVVLRSHAIRLTNKYGHLLHQIAILGTNLNAVPVQASITPDKPDQPGQVIRPRSEEPGIKRVAEYRLCQASSGTSPELRALAHRLAVGDLRGAHSHIISYHQFQRCHLNYDRDEHMANAAATRRRRKVEAGQEELPL